MFIKVKIKGPVINHPTGPIKEIQVINTDTISRMFPNPNGGTIILFRDNATITVEHHIDEVFNCIPDGCSLV